MKNNRLRSLIVTGLLLMNVLSVASADTPRHVLWNKAIIPLQLPIGHEKIIEFCAAGPVSGCKTIGFKPYIPVNMLDKGRLTYLGANGALYLTAKKPFSNALIQVVLNNTDGNTVLLRLSASKTANRDRIEIVIPGHNTSPQSLMNQVQKNHSLGDEVRWVAQQLYAPKRLLTQPTWIHRIPMHTHPFVPLYRGAAVSCMPLASWRSGDDYVTAVLLRNTLSHERVVLSHTWLRGDWIAASFFRLSTLNPAILTRAHTRADSTSAILVSSMPFNAALQAGVS